MIMKKTKKKTRLTCEEMWFWTDEVALLKLFATMPLMLLCIPISDYLGTISHTLGVLSFFIPIGAWMIYFSYKLDVIWWQNTDYEEWKKKYNEEYEFVGDE